MRGDGLCGSRATASRLRGGLMSKLASGRACWAVVAVVCCVAAAADGLVATSVGKGAAEAGQKAIILDLGNGDEILVLQITYSGDASDFAWVIPVPTMPRADGIARAPDWFVQRLFEQTAPRVETLSGQERYQGVEAMAERGRPPDALPPEQVVVWQTLQVGPYTAQVLQATAPGILDNWLARHGYKLPAKAALVLDRYVRRGWFFVTLKIAAPAVGERLRQGDLPALAITFPKRDYSLVYPLAISSISARGRCAVDVIVIARWAAQCREMPIALPPQRLKTRGKTIWQGMCELTDGGRQALLLWRSPSTPLPEDAAPEFLPFRPQWRAMWCQRVWMWLKPDQMRDLHFEPSLRGAAAVRLSIVRSRPVSRSALAALRQPPDQVYRHARRWLQGQLVSSDQAAVALIAFVVVVGAVIGILVVILLRRVFGVTLGVLALALSAALLCSGALAGITMPGESWSAWDYAAGKMHRAIARFVDRFGAYPLRAADLLARRPRYGQDVSGNRVRIGPSALWRPLRQLPPDPVTGKRTTWLIDLAAPELVTSRRMEVVFGRSPVSPVNVAELFPSLHFSPRR